MIDQLPCMFRKNVQQARQPIELVDIGDLANIPVEDLHYTVFEPCAAPRMCRPMQHFRIAAAQNECQQFVPEYRTLLGRRFFA